MSKANDDGWRVVSFGGREYSIKSFGSGDLINKALDRGRFYEERLLIEIRKLGMTGIYVDVGAHVGNHTLFFLAECPSDGVIAVEPGPPADRCRETLRSWGHSKPWALYEVAASNKSGRVGYSAPRSNTGAGRISLRGTGFGRIALDGLLGWANVGVIKIDAEGHDRFALMGLEKTIKRCRPVISCEAKTSGIKTWLRAWLKPLGYRHLGTYDASQNQLWTPG